MQIRICLFCFYLITISVACALQYRVTGWSVSNKLETLIAIWRDWRKSRQISIGIAGLQNHQFWVQDLLKLNLIICYKKCIIRF
jgi:hypothetical protein